MSEIVEGPSGAKEVAPVVAAPVAKQQQQQQQQQVHLFGGVVSLPNNARLGIISDSGGQSSEEEEEEEKEEGGGGVEGAKGQVGEAKKGDLQSDEEKGEPVAATTTTTTITTTTTCKRKKGGAWSDGAEEDGGDEGPPSPSKNRVSRKRKRNRVSAMLSTTSCPCCRKGSGSKSSSGSGSSTTTPAGGAVRGDATPHVPSSILLGRATAGSRGGEGVTTFVGECDLPTDKGSFRLRAYRHLSAAGATHEPVVMVSGDLRGKHKVALRVHDQCQTSEVLGSRRCDCREQLDASLAYIKQHEGAVIYLQQEGRGIGLANKVAAYHLQDGGMDTVDANRALGLPDDARSYGCVSHILADMGIKSVALMTNNPYKLEWMRATGVEVEERIPMLVPPNPHNERYLEAKAARMSHLINQG